MTRQDDSRESNPRYPDIRQFVGREGPGRRSYHATFPTAKIALDVNAACG